MTVQRALGELRDEGLIVSTQGRGLFVAYRPGPSGPTDLAVNESLRQALRNINDAEEHLEEAQEQTDPDGATDPETEAGPLDETSRLVDMATEGLTRIQDQLEPDDSPSLRDT